MDEAAKSEIIDKIKSETDAIFKELAKIIKQNNALKEDIDTIIKNQHLIFSKLK